MQTKKIKSLPPEAVFQISRHFGEITNRYRETRPLVEAFARELKNWIRCSALAIRICDEEGKAVHQFSRGFGPLFSARGNCRSHSQGCRLCNRVIAGRVERGSPAFTSGGSFYTNRADQFVTRYPQKRGGIILNQCIGFGFQSIALVPIPSGESNRGLFHLADHKVEKLPLEKVTLLEEIARHLGGALRQMPANETPAQIFRTPKVKQRQSSVTGGKNREACEALKASEARSHSIAQTANDAILSIDRGGRIIFWNQASEKIFGYTLDESMGKKLSMIIPPSQRQSHQKGINRFLRTGNPRIIGNTVEKIGLRKDGSEFPMELSLSFWEEKENPHFTAIVRDITDRKKAEEAWARSLETLGERVKKQTAVLVAENNRLKEELAHRKKVERTLKRSAKKLRLFSSQIINAQENERQRVAKGLHDGIAQHLGAIKFRLEEALYQQGKKPGSENTPDSIAELIPVLQEAIEEVRSIYMNLRPTILDDLGLLATISWSCREFRTLHPDIATNRQVKVKEEEIPERLRIIIYRVMQEALNNAARHSGASRIRLALKRKDGHIVLSVWDNGKGFDLKEKSTLKKSTRRLGLAIMKGRTIDSGGVFEVISKEERGTTIQASWAV